jgi:hypothetical protein
MRTRTAVTVAGAALSALTVLTGCSTGSPHSDVADASAPVVVNSAPAAGASPTARASPTTAANPKAAYETQLLAWGRQLAQCARQHGLARFPDPVKVGYDGSGIGLPEFPSAPKEDLAAAMERCPELTRQMPHPPPPGPPSAATLQKMRQYAQCMRQHGANGFPDPRADGTFPIRGTRFAGVAPFSEESTPAAMINADRTCRRYQGGWYVRAS